MFTEISSKRNSKIEVTSSGSTGEHIEQGQPLNSQQLYILYGKWNGTHHCRIGFFTYKRIRPGVKRVEFVTNVIIHNTTIIV
jgi:hypothetical protein